MRSELRCWHAGLSLDRTKSWPCPTQPIPHNRGFFWCNATHSNYDQMHVLSLGHFSSVPSPASSSMHHPQTNTTTLSGSPVYDRKSQATPIYECHKFRGGFLTYSTIALPTGFGSIVISRFIVSVSRTCYPGRQSLELFI